MRLIAIAGLAGLSAAVAMGARPAGLWQIYQQLYPSDPAQRRALDLCFAQDPRFDRLDPAAREACYRHMLPAVAPAASGDPGRRRAPRANFVDLWRSAGHGHLPQNDIRAQEENERYTHPHSPTRMR